MTSATSTPFLSPGLATLANPRLERIHRIGHEAKLLIIPESAQDLDGLIAQHELAIRYLRREQRDEH
jgi:hypothetical protein